MTPNLTNLEARDCAADGARDALVSDIAMGYVCPRCESDQWVTRVELPKAVRSYCNRCQHVREIPK
jgi:hypothetical protein